MDDRINKNQKAKLLLPDNRTIRPKITIRLNNKLVLYLLSITQRVIEIICTQFYTTHFFQLTLRVILSTY